MIQATISKTLPAGPESPEFSLEVEFEAASGVTVLFGPSGSGKTLTLDSIAGFLKPDSGRILLDGRILFDAGAGVHLPPQKRACGYVFQNQALFPNMTIRENLAFAAAAVPRLERHRRIAEMLDRFKLTPMAGRCPHELSGGQKQRAAIARALIADPRVILLDEPARGLDVSLRDDLHTLIHELRASLKVPIFLVTHDAEECFALADHVLIYDAGRIVHRGTPAELFANPGTAAAAKLLGGFNIFEAEVVAIDPGRQSSRLRLLGEEIAGPHLRGCFRGDRITVCVRPEELKVAARSVENGIRAELLRTTAKAQSIRADFGGGLIVDMARETWRGLEDTARSGLWVQIPAASLRQLS
ncbi:MAG TPA: ABC transporter ATP-binding protein [Bryobacteraceae bacterium]|nr:ABC transporter ATP-binding protein [Bryobacteraceae bacterium]